MRLEVRCSPALLRDLDRESQARGETRSRFVRVVLAEWLRSYSGTDPEPKQPSFPFG